MGVGGCLSLILSPSPLSFCMDSMLPIPKNSFSVLERRCEAPPGCWCLNPGGTSHSMSSWSFLLWSSRARARRMRGCRKPVGRHRQARCMCHLRVHGKGMDALHMMVTHESVRTWMLRNSRRGATWRRNIILERSPSENMSIRWSSFMARSVIPEWGSEWPVPLVSFQAHKEISP